VCAKSLRQLVLTRTGKEGAGFQTEAELGEDGEDELRVFVTGVQLHGAAHRCGQCHFSLLLIIGRSCSQGVHVHPRPNG